MLRDFVYLPLFFTTTIKPPVAGLKGSLSASIIKRFEA